MFKKILILIGNRNSLSILLSIIIFILVIALSNTNILYFLDKKVQNTIYSIHNNFIGNKISKDILIIEIDDKTLESGGDLGRFPFDRKDYINVIKNLNNAGVAVIAFDIIFTEKTDSDKLFADEIAKGGNIVIGSYITKDPLNSKNKIFKKSIFNNEIKATGFFSPKLDPYNHIVYSLFPFVKINENKIYNHFSISIIKTYFSFMYNKDFINFESQVDDKYYYITPNRKAPFSSKGQKDILINYIKNDKFHEKGKVLSFIDIYDNNKFNTIREYIDFKDKIVIIGASAKGIKDIFYTPNGIEPGVYVHANFINTVLTKNYLQYFDEKIEYILLFLLILLSVYFNLSRSGYVLIISNISLVIIFLIIFPSIIIFGTNLILNFLVELFFALIISLALSNIVKYMIENKHKTKLNKALSEYVSADVASEILSGAGKINLNGENKKISIFFSDIEGFTSISEKFSPEELVAFLREYLSSMSNIIMDNKGFINKYEGDAIMALWGVFGDKSKDDSYNICFSSLKQQEKLKELNKEWSKRGFSEIKVRIGIHIGNAIIGNIGSEGRKMEFTALGDNVNIASRLEGVNKFYGTYLCASETIYEIEKDNFEFRYLDQIKVKGKKVPIKIYELLGIKKEVDSSILEIRDLFEKAVSLYLNRDFIGAKEIFEKLVNSGDNAGRMYIDMCNIYIKTPPKSDWNGISVMNSK